MSKNWYPVINFEACTACGACLKKCSHGVFADKGGTIIMLKPEGCAEGCHGCQKLCPTGAISYFGENDPNLKPSGSGCGCK
jgi:NAD-dependent dihydropyrimidine dehydrogenase PreA subunit